MKKWKINDINAVIKHLNVLITWYFSKTTAHDEEVRKLYEEMEVQIKQEKEKILGEVRNVYIHVQTAILYIMFNLCFYSLQTEFEEGTHVPFYSWSVGW